MSEPRPVPRRQQILEALAREIEQHPASRITTARLAGVVGVSEAALYRHFPGKAAMFEALIEFSEEAVFGLVNRILAEEPGGARRRCERVVGVVLGFAERNAGITRVLIGEALVGEDRALSQRVARFFDRLETQLRILIRDAEDADLARRSQAAREREPGHRVHPRTDASVQHQRIQSPSDRKPRPPVGDARRRDLRLKAGRGDWKVDRFPRDRNHQ